MELVDSSAIEKPSNVGLETITKPAKEKFTFTKLTMCVIFVLFTIGAIIGGILVIISAMHDISLGIQIDTGMYIAYATYLGAPAATAIGFYAWKSKAENILKIKKSNTLDEIPSILANMRGVD